MKKINFLLKTILIAFVIFIIINYAIKKSAEDKMIDEIIQKKIDVSDDKDGAIADLNQLKHLYFTEKFKIYLTRGAIFSILLFVVSYYILIHTKDNKFNDEYNNGINYPDPNQQNMFFTAVPF